MIKRINKSKTNFENQSAKNRKYTSDKKHHEVKDHCHNTGTYRGAAHSICNFKYDVSKEITVVFYNELNNHYIIKEVVKKFEKYFNCLREKTEILKIFSFPITKEVKSIDKDYKNPI